jgi:mannosyltransferase OCH1-like enzyme
MIPRRLIRTVPEVTDPQVDLWWAKACDMHPSWHHMDLRDPLDHQQFPTTASLWRRCSSGAQVAGLIRLEALYRFGGIYVDSDLELWRSLEPLLPVSCFASYEDPGVIPDFVLGSEPGHPAIKACLDLAVGRVREPEGDWRTSGPWGTGPGVTTTVLAGRHDVLLLPPACFAPYHYSDKDTVDVTQVRAENPWSFGAHHWAHSWR